MALIYVGLYISVVYIKQSRGAMRQTVEDCFKLMRLENRAQQLFVPACVQFKIKKFVSSSFQNLVAKVSGVLRLNFFIFTENEQLRNFLCDRLYFNPKEEKQLESNRRKKVKRGSVNYLPVMFNKDGNIKLPTTRTKDFQIQSFKADIKYEKGHESHVTGVRICHIIRKDFDIELKRSNFFETFFTPFTFLNLELIISLEHMDVAEFQFEDKVPKKLTLEEKSRQERENAVQVQRQRRYMADEEVRHVKRVSFNLLRIEEPYRSKTMEKNQRVETLAAMITFSPEVSYEKYALVQTELQAYTHDQRELPEWEQSEQLLMKQLFQDLQPTQLHFKPFKYAVFKIPMYRYPIVDMMTIFIPLWLLSFVSIYIYFQPTEIITRVMNVAALMIAYAAIQPIVRESMPEATSITLVDLLLYSELVVNILFIISTINTRSLHDNLSDAASNPYPRVETNAYYDRWGDAYFIASLVISIGNVVVVLLLILIYLCRKGGYQASPAEGNNKTFSTQNWTLTLLMERTFARYRERLIFIP